MMSAPSINHAIEHAFALLPAAAQELVVLVGVPHTLALVEAMGGTHYPMTQGRGRAQARVAQLTAIVGGVAAHTLMAHYGSGTELYVPKCDAALRHMRNLRIKQLFDEMTQHMSAIDAVNALVQQFGLCDRTIWRILKTPDVIEANAAQSGLF